MSLAVEDGVWPQTLGEQQNMYRLMPNSTIQEIKEIKEGDWTGQIKVGDWTGQIVDIETLVHCLGWKRLHFCPYTHWQPENSWDSVEDENWGRCLCYREGAECMKDFDFKRAFLARNTGSS